jgi:hypothetical protein
MPARKRSRLLAAIRSFFGDSYPLVEHIVQMTAVFIVMLGCLFIARKLVPLMFPPGEFLAAVLHAVDTYAALLGTVGYAVWLTLEMFSIVVRRIRRAVREEQDDQGQT